MRPERSQQQADVFPFEQFAVLSERRMKKISRCLQSRGSSSKQSAVLIGMLQIFLLLSFGCSAGRYYVPGEIPINRNANTPFYVSKNISVTNASNFQKVSLGSYWHGWEANLKLWTESAVGLLKSELLRATTVDDRAEAKSLALSITRANLFWESREMNSTVVLHALAGNGVQKTCEVTGIAQSLALSSDRAITKAVACLLDDPEIRSYLAPKDSDSDGVFDGIDKCPGTPLGVKVDENGCPPVVAPKPREEAPPPVVSFAPQERHPQFSDILFDFNKHNIKSDFQSEMERVVEFMKNNPSVKLEVQGHTDRTGTEKYNQGLSNRRAMEVCRYLSEKGIPMDRLLPTGYGFSKPRSGERTPEGDALDRRVVLIPLKSDQ
ncbi:MAG: OmpA family protein [Desulfobacteraceae bacterium]|nr:MAG: OmpA family protein [Desulfobacteraceae bacterium]